jgi:hypothetical protein
MKKSVLMLIILVLLIPKYSKAQNNTAKDIATVAGGLLAIGVGIAAVEEMKERAELTATQWIVLNHPELKSFSLKTLDFNGKKLKDLSSTSVISFKIQEFNPSDKIVLDGKKQVLFGFTSYGWINETGIDFNKVKWFLIDSKEWMNMMVAYSKVSSSEKNEAIIKEKLSTGKIVNNGIKVKNKVEVPFYKLEGDMYLVTDYSSEMKFIYNEKSLGIFLKETGDLVQMGRNSLIETHEFYFEEK